jgi:hypothetical protein
VTPKVPVPARLWVYLARDAPIGAILRRGPKEWVQMNHWDTKNDIFTPGQWFHGRLYPKRGGLSPDGKLLIYFAAKYHRPHNPPTSYRMWTAICKPPYYTALYFAPDFDTYGGGGLFLDDHAALLNTAGSADMEVAEPYPGFKVIVKREIYFENALYYKHLEANGWTSITGDPYTRTELTNVNGVIVNGSVPTRWAKLMYNHKLMFAYANSSLRYQFIDEANGKTIDLDKVEWADFDQQKRLVLAKAGKLFSAAVVDGELALTELADFNANQPEAIESPAWAKRW